MKEKQDKIDQLEKEFGVKRDAAREMMMRLQNEVVVHERVESLKVLSAKSSNHSIILNEGSFDEVEDFDEFKHNLLKN
jgi:hypothetical protein